MKLYNFPQAPNCWRVRAYLSEKGLECPTSMVDLNAGESRTEEFGKINSLHETPVLELDDGTRIAESIAICRYFEDLHPEPNLMGTTPLERAQIEMWNRRAEIHLMNTVGNIAIHSFDFFKDKVEQLPTFVETQRRLAPRKWAWLDSELSDGRAFLAGERFTLADITGMCALRIAGFVDQSPAPDLANVARWADSVMSRPSWEA